MMMHHLNALEDIPVTGSKGLSHFITLITIRNKSDGHNEPNLQLSISTSKLDHMAELLEATSKMTKYFKKSYKHNI